MKSTPYNKPLNQTGRLTSREPPSAPVAEEPRESLVLSGDEGYLLGSPFWRCLQVMGISVMPQRDAFRHARLQNTARVARDFGHSFRSLMNYREDDHVMAHLLLTVLVVRKEVGTFLPWASAAAGGCE